MNVFYFFSLSLFLAMLVLFLSWLLSVLCLSPHSFNCVYAFSFSLFLLPYEPSCPSSVSRLVGWSVIIKSVSFKEKAYNLKFSRIRTFIFVMQLSRDPINPARPLFRSFSISISHNVRPLFRLKRFIT